MTLVAATLLVTLAVPTFGTYAQHSRVDEAIGDISELSRAIDQYQLSHDGRIPLSLAELGPDVPLDPWGRSYEYVNILATESGGGELRSDGRLIRINTDFDLYSRGADGVSTSSLSAQSSRDDVMRANNGAFIGLGEDY